MRLKLILTLIGLVAVLMAGPARGQSTQDEVLLEMQKAFQKGDSARLTALLPRTRGHLLEPWAAYWELRARLESASADEVKAFFKAFAGTYQEDRLRNDWLLVLGQRRDWAEFALVAPEFRMNDDPEVRCYTLAMDHQTAAINRADELKALWYAQRGSGDACTLAAQSHLAAGSLSDTEVWHKARLALEARQLEATRRAVALVAPQAGADLEQALGQPEKFLSQRRPSHQRLTQELAVLALVRLAERQSDRAAELLRERWSPRLSPAQRDWAWGSIGEEAAVRLSDTALNHFAQVRPQSLPDGHLAWRTRAALRQGRWAEVLASIQAMSADAAADPAWVYWRARALLQPQRTPAEQQRGRELLQSVAGIGGFYPMLAQEELGLPIDPPPPPPPLTEAETSRARANPHLQRALAALALGLRSEGVREWNYATNLHQPGGMNDRELYAAADLACQHAVWDRCINTSERTRSFMDLGQRYPMPHREAVVERSREIDLDPAYVYGLIRQESRFITDARSSAGASGLMQVMPATARWTARKIGLTDFKPHQINERDTNIAIGTGYLKLVLDDFAGSLPMAAAAYNAGPGRPRLWRGQAGQPRLEAAIWAENIPFSETRDYVKKVLANTTVYAAMISGQAQSLKARLGTIGPRDAPASDNLELP